MFWDDIRPKSRILAENAIFSILGGKSAKMSENHKIPGILPGIAQETYAFPCATATFCEGARKERVNAIFSVFSDFLSFPLFYR